MTARTAVAAAEPPNRPLTVEDLAPREREQPSVWVHVWGRWRRGTVVQVGRRRGRVQVRYVSDLAGNTHERWFSARGRTDDVVYDGRLPGPLSYQCPLPRCRLVCTGRPGQTVEQIRTAHDQSPQHVAGSN